MMRRNAKKDMQKLKTDIEKLEEEISQMKSRSGSFILHELLKQSMNYESCLTAGASSSAPQGYQGCKVHKRLAVFRDNFGAGKLKPEHECAMVPVGGDICCFHPMCTSGPLRGVQQAT